MNSRFEVSSATGVDLQLNIAGPGARSYAFVIDWHIRLLLALAWFVVMTFVIVGSMKLLEADDQYYLQYVMLVLVPTAVIYVLYHPVLEIVMRGRTPGKRMAGVRVVTLDGQEPGLLAHLIRNILRLLDSLPAGYVVGLVSTVLTDKAVRIGDIAAGTVLIYDSDARGEKLEATPASAIAISRYGIARAELGQDLLNRWDQLDVFKRDELARRLLARLEPGMLPETDSARLRLQLQRLLGAGAPDGGKR